MFEESGRNECEVSQLAASLAKEKKKNARQEIAAAISMHLLTLLACALRTATRRPVQNDPNSVLLLPRCEKMAAVACR